MRPIYRKDDYTGFTYGGIHSSLFGLFSVTSGSRYNRNLAPSFSDSTARATGLDGTYYFGYSVDKRNIPLSIAFDSVTETEYREIRRWLMRGVQELILDEEPYIKYYAKLDNEPVMAFVPFEEDGRRIYKGEMNLNFVCYNPYGHSVAKWLDAYGRLTASIDKYATNVVEWQAASRLLMHLLNVWGNFDIFEQVDSSMYRARLYNPGDLPANFKLNLTMTGDIDIIAYNQNLDKANINWHLDMALAQTLFSSAPSTIKVTIDTEKRLVLLEANDEIVVGNEALTGEFRKLITNKDIRDFTYMEIINVAEAPTIEYEYIYY